MLTAGQVHDIHSGRALLASVPPMRRLVADKAYDANDLRDFLASQGTEPAILPTSRRLVRPVFDTTAYRARNQTERAFCRLKDWRAIATRYDKTACNFLAGICPCRRHHGFGDVSPHPKIPSRSPSVGWSYRVERLQNTSVVC